VFDTAEKAFRQREHLNPMDVGVRESTFLEKLQEAFGFDPIANGERNGARV
jgi:hypothetical protein